MRMLLLLSIFVGAWAEEGQRNNVASATLDTFEALRQRRPTVINAWICGQLYTGQLWCVRRQYGSRILRATPFGAPVHWRSIVGQ